MSFHVVSWVLEHSPAKLATRLVLISMADHASKDGTDAYPSVKTLAHEARVSRSAVQSAIRELKAARAVFDEGASAWGTRRYRVSTDLADQTWPTKGGSDSVPPKSQAGGAQILDTGGADSVPKPVLEPAQKQSSPLPLPEQWQKVLDRFEGEHALLTIRHCRLVEYEGALTVVGPEQAIGWIEHRLLRPVEEALGASVRLLDEQSIPTTQERAA